AADALVDGFTVSAHSFPTADTSRGVVTDVSGCRLSGRVYQSNTTAPDPTSCSTVTCHANGVATAESHCGPMERCRGGGRYRHTSRGRPLTSDLCTDLPSSALNGLRLLGVFRDRSRRDTTWLDQVIVQLGGGAQISLKQGGVLWGRRGSDHRRLGENGSRFLFPVESVFTCDVDHGGEAVEQDRHAVIGGGHLGRHACMVFRNIHAVQRLGPAAQRQRFSVRLQGAPQSTR
ncbi:unnamed protein product, partial [Menidia menidia]